MTTKEQIDLMPLEDMLRKNRFAPIGDPLFQGEIGDYFMEVMKEKKSNISPEEWTRISKNLGWDR